MSISNNRKLRKPFFVLSGGTGVFIVALILLAGSGFALNISITPMTAALAQEEEDNTTITATRPSNTTTTTISAASSNIELSPQPIYQEHVRDLSETLINQTHAQLVVEGNGTLTLPNSTETISTTRRYDTSGSRRVSARWKSLAHLLGMAEWDTIRKDAAATDDARVSNEYNRNTF
jgi:hypothetical protein